MRQTIFRTKVLLFVPILFSWVWSIYLDVFYKNRVIKFYIGAVIFSVVGAEVLWHSGLK
jgi:hypothetical protein